jgi:hypothetical protein
MDFTITTPAVLLPALSLIMLAHTNRFLGLAAVIRNLKREFDANGDENKALQLRSLSKRLHMIRRMQVYGVASMLTCVLSMFCIFIHAPDTAKWLFAGSLLLMSISLLVALREVFLSMETLRLELKSFDERH